VEQGGVNNTMNGGTGNPSAFGSSTTGVVPSGDATGTGTGTGTTGTNSTGAPSGNWWESPAVLAALAGAGASLGAGWMQSNGAKDAAEIQRQSAADALKVQQDQFAAQQKNLEPWMTKGANALDQLENFDTNNAPFTFNNDDPSYKWRFKEGMKALENSMSARRVFGSGNELRGITDYAQGAASQEYNNAFNRYQTERGSKLNRLQSLAGIGQSAVGQVNQAGQNYASNAGNLITGAGQAQAVGVSGSNDAWASGLMGLGNAFQNGLSNYYQQQENDTNRKIMNRLIGGV
jgi:hypothetical protein